MRQCIEGKWCEEQLMRGKVEVREEWKSGWKGTCEETSVDEEGGGERVWRVEMELRRGEGK